MAREPKSHPYPYASAAVGGRVLSGRGVRCNTLAVLGASCVGAVEGVDVVSEDDGLVVLSDAIGVVREQLIAGRPQVDGRWLGRY